MEETALVKVEALNPIALFTEGGIAALLKEIESKAKNFTPDISGAKGRKEISSMAHKVSRSKVVLDDLGKNLVSEWKTKSKKVDEARKEARDRLDELRDEVRQPLTLWEQAEEARIAAEQLAAEMEQAHAEALAENSLYDRQKAVEAKEAELARIEEERRQKEEAELLELERIENEKRQKEQEAKRIKEAEERAKLKAEEDAKARIAEAERKEREAKEAVERAEREKIAAAERARIEQERAVQEAERKAKEEADRKEQMRLAEEDRKRAEEKIRSANVENQRAKNAAACAAFVKNGIDEATARKVISLIAKGMIDHIGIHY